MTTQAQEVIGNMIEELGVIGELVDGIEELHEKAWLTDALISHIRQWQQLNSTQTRILVTALFKILAEEDGS
jgi:hypothetical protein